jgi:hypothetical protein
VYCVLRRSLVVVIVGHWHNLWRSSTAASTEQKRVLCSCPNRSGDVPITRVCPKDPSSCGSTTQILLKDCFIDRCVFSLALESIQVRSQHRVQVENSDFAGHIDR